VEAHNITPAHSIVGTRAHGQHVAPIVATQGILRRLMVTGRLLMIRLERNPCTTSDTTLLAIGNATGAVLAHDCSKYWTDDTAT
jgi:hypothetical protein